MDSEELDDLHTVSSAEGDAVNTAVPKDPHNGSKRNESEAREIILTADGVSLTPGVGVAVRVRTEKLLQLQRQCGGTISDGMKTVSTVPDLTAFCRREREQGR